MTVNCSGILPNQQHTINVSQYELVLTLLFVLETMGFVHMPTLRHSEKISAMTLKMVDQTKATKSWVTF